MKDYEYYWSTLPIGKENAYTYSYLCTMWNCNERHARKIMQELSNFDNGDNYVLIRSSHNKGFYLSNDIEEIKMYLRECESRAKNIFRTVKKARRITKNVS